jgi:cytochrome o ubiquinol oxidase subunit IV
MNHHESHQPDYGTGQKKLSTYVIGTISCIILTIISFWAVMAGNFSKMQTLAIIYISACVQFVVQLICFLRLNTETEQGQMNVMSLVFTVVILVCIVVGSVWIMWNLDYYMTH